MKLPDVILIALSAGFLLVGIYDMVKHGASGAYGFIMLSVVFFFWYTYRKNNRKDA